MPLKREINFLNKEDNNDEELTTTTTKNLGKKWNYHKVTTKIKK